MMTLEKFMNEFVDGKSDKDTESSSNWINSYRQDWMTDDQWLLSLFLCRLFNGFHHCPEIKESNCRGNIAVNTRTGYFANFDYDYLTKAVIMAHNWGVRIQISGSAPGMIKISLWKRHSREGDICNRMPTIQEMVDKYQNY
jgi:hypothetical protein